MTVLVQFALLILFDYVYISVPLCTWYLVLGTWNLGRLEEDVGSSGTGVLHTHEPGPEPRSSPRTIALDH